MTSRRPFAAALLAAIVSSGCGTDVDESTTIESTAAFDVIEATIPEMQRAMEDGRTTSRELVRQYLSRIAIYENLLNPTISVNPNALADAERLDAERAAGRVRGPLHGIPIALKDNIHTTDMPTTGGALAFEGFIPPYEATITENLRAAGAIIIAKTVLTELANWVAGDPFDMPDNYSSFGGYAFNPYDPRRDPRAGIADGKPALENGGSSSGIGTSASLWAANVGTETSGSIIWPSNQNMLVGIKPTVGRVSRYGIIPITADQDTAGPMARTVTDAAVLMGVLEGEPDSNDPASGRCDAPTDGDYTAFLDTAALSGARIGVPRAGFIESETLSNGIGARGGIDPARAALIDDAIDVLRDEGAIVVDPANIPSVVEPDPANNFLNWPICAGSGDTRGNDSHCSTVFKYGMQRDFNAWLTSLGATAPVSSLSELRDWNNQHATLGTIRYGQARIDISSEVDLDADRARYETDRAKDIELGGPRGIDSALNEHELDALLFPMNRGSNIAARPGYPSIIVPFGFAPNDAGPPFPDDFDARPAPFGVTFVGTACSEPLLIGLAYAFEQATRRRVPPPRTP